MGIQTWRGPRGQNGSRTCTAAFVQLAATNQSPPRPLLEQSPRQRSLPDQSPQSQMVPDRSPQQQVLPDRSPQEQVLPDQSPSDQ